MKIFPKIVGFIQIGRRRSGNNLRAELRIMESRESGQGRPSRGPRIYLLDNATEKGAFSIIKWRDRAVCADRLFIQMGGHQWGGLVSTKNSIFPPPTLQLDPVRTYVCAETRQVEEHGFFFFFPIPWWKQGETAIYYIILYIPYSTKSRCLY